MAVKKKKGGYSVRTETKKVESELKKLAAQTKRAQAAIKKLMGKMKSSGNAPECS